MNTFLQLVGLATLVGLWSAIVWIHGSLNAIYSVFTNPKIEQTARAYVDARKKIESK